jgi:hypothetical protein
MFCRAVSRQIESPSSKEVPVPEDPMTAREPLVSYGKQYRLPTIYGIFLMNFQRGKFRGLNSVRIRFFPTVIQGRLLIRISGRFICNFLILQRICRTAIHYMIN